MDKQTRNGVLIALATMFIWAGTYLTARFVTGQISPILMSMCRWGVAGIIVCILFLPRIKREWKAIRSYMPNIIVAALTGYVIFPLFTYYAAGTTSTVNISLISVTSSIFIVMITAFMGEKVSLNTWIGCIIALLGSVYLVSNGELSVLLELKFVAGDLFMLAAAIAFAIYCIALKNPPEGLSNISILGIMIIITVVMLSPFAAWDAVQPDVLFNLTPIVIGSIVFSGVVICIISWWTWNTALVMAGPVLCGMIYYTITIVSAIYGYVFLDEPVTKTHYISALLIVGGIIWSEHGHRLIGQKQVEQSDS